MGSTFGNNFFDFAGISARKPGILEWELEDDEKPGFFDLLNKQAPLMYAQAQLIGPKPKEPAIEPQIEQTPEPAVEPAAEPVAEPKIKLHGPQEADAHMYNKLAGMNYDQGVIDELTGRDEKEFQRLQNVWQSLRMQGENVAREIADREYQITQLAAQRATADPNARASLDKEIEELQYRNGVDRTTLSRINQLKDAYETPDWILKHDTDYRVREPANYKISDEQRKLERDIANKTHKRIAKNKGITAGEITDTINAMKDLSPEMKEILIGRAGELADAVTDKRNRDADAQKQQYSLADAARQNEKGKTEQDLYMNRKKHIAKFVNDKENLKYLKNFEQKEAQLYELLDRLSEAGQKADEKMSMDILNLMQASKNKNLDLKQRKRNYVAIFNAAKAQYGNIK
jgi:hypothetical protein